MRLIAGMAVFSKASWNILPRGTKFHKIILGILLLVAPCLHGQTINESNFQTILISGSGRTLNANTAVCTLGLTTTGASISGNVATLTFGSNPQTAGYLRGSLLTVSLFTGADTIFNGTFPIAAVSSTTISYFLVHASATASSVGLAFQTGTQGNPCAPLATIFTDYSGATQAPNPSTSGPLGNVSIWAPSGVYNLQYYGLGIVTKVIAFSIGGTGGGGGSGQPNLGVTFANVTSATLNASSLNSTNMIFQCWDNSTPNANPIGANASLNLTTLVVTFGFTVPQSGFCAVNASGNGGGGSGPTTGVVLLAPIITQNVAQPPGTSLNISSINQVLNAAMFTGADIFAKANAAYTSCSNGCTVYIPAGTYAATTTLAFPVVSNGTASLVMDPGAIITYSGSGDAISLMGNNNGNVNAIISGGQIIGSSSGVSGIHAKAFASLKITNTQVRGFTNGDAFFNQGVNTFDCFSCVAESNKNGVHNVGVVVGGNLFAANAIHFHGGLIQLNTNWGWFEDSSQVSFVGVNQNNTAESVTFEANGTNASSTTGQVFVQQCSACAFQNDYYEPAVGAEPLSVITLGDSTNQASATIIKGNLFASFGATNTINDVNSSHTVTEHNTEFIANTNFYNHGTLSSGTYIGCNAVASTNYLAGVDTGGDTFSNCNPLTQTYPNISAPGPLGYRFNQLSGYNQDLTVRTRTGGTYNIQGQDIMDTRRTWGVTDFGAGEFTGLYTSGTPNLSTSSCGTLASSQGGNWAGAVNSGVTGTCTLVITPGFTAPHGFRCSATDMTTPADILSQSSFSATSCTLLGTTVSGDTISWQVVGF